jgi:hypothetical protein
MERRQIGVRLFNCDAEDELWSWCKDTASTIHIYNLGLHNQYDYKR